MICKFVKYKRAGRWCDARFDRLESVKVLASRFEAAHTNTIEGYFAILKRGMVGKRLTYKDSSPASVSSRVAREIEADEDHSAADELVERLAKTKPEPRKASDK